MDQLPCSDPVMMGPRSVSSVTSTSRRWKSVITSHPWVVGRSRHDVLFASRPVVVRRITRRDRLMPSGSRKE